MANPLPIDARSPPFKSHLNFVFKPPSLDSDSARERSQNRSISYPYVHKPQEVELPFAHSLWLPMAGVTGKVLELMLRVMKGKSSVLTQRPNVKLRTRKGGSLATAGLDRCCTTT